MYERAPLKKLIAISLVFLILFNTLGFYGLLVGLGFRVRQDLVQRLDNDQYRPEETMTLKVPLSVPYYMDDDEFQRVNGEIEHQGEFYRLVKQKLVQDTLYIVCIKDNKSKQIKKALTDYVKTFTDKPIDNKHHTKTVVIVLKDYIPSSFSISHESEGWNTSVVNSFSSAFFYDRAIAVSIPPPKV